MNCSERCSRHCLNNKPCDHVSGVCSDGCQDGFSGTYCRNCKRIPFILKHLVDIIVTVKRYSFPELPDTVIKIAKVADFSKKSCVHIVRLVFFFWSIFFYRYFKEQGEYGK